MIDIKSIAKIETVNLEKIARDMRRNIIEMIYEVQSGHPGGSLSSVEILASLYFSVLKHNPNNPKWPERDKFVLSKAHACPVLYVALAQSGYFPETELLTIIGFMHHVSAPQVKYFKDYGCHMVIGRNELLKNLNFILKKIFHAD